MSIKHYYILTRYSAIKVVLFSCCLPYENLFSTGETDVKTTSKITADVEGDESSVQRRGVV